MTMVQQNKSAIKRDFQMFLLAQIEKAHMTVDALTILFPNDEKIKRDAESAQQALLDVHQKIAAFSP